MSAGPDIVFFRELCPFVELTVSFVTRLLRNPVAGDANGDVVFGVDVLALVSFDRNKLVWVPALAVLSTTFRFLFFFLLFHDVADVKKFSFLVIGFDITTFASATLSIFTPMKIS